MRWCFGATLTVLLLMMLPAEARMAPPTFGQLLKGAKAIAIVKVEKLHVIGGVNVAEATVLKSYRQVEKAQRVIYLADPTWVCDTTTAREGEIVLLFLEDLPDRLRWRLGKQKPERLKTLLIAAFGNDPLFRISR